MVHRSAALFGRASVEDDAEVPSCVDPFADPPRFAWNNDLAAPTDVSCCDGLPTAWNACEGKWQACENPSEASSAAEQAPASKLRVLLTSAAPLSQAAIDARYVGPSPDSWLELGTNNDAAEGTKVQINFKSDAQTGAHGPATHPRVWLTAPSCVR